MNKESKIETRLIHAGETSGNDAGAVIAPLHQSATYLYPNPHYPESRYIRSGNTPNQEAIGEKIANIEGTESALVTASGMAAISNTLLALVKRGEHILAQDDLYGGTFSFLKEYFPDLGRSVTFFSLDRGGDLADLVKPETRAIYVESTSNPLLKIPDLPAITRFAKQRGLVTMIDNTFPSPINFNPVDMGFDIVLHSATKYLNGHTDIVGGVVAGSRKHIDAIVPLFRELGGSMDPHTAYLLTRGIKTLAVRVRWQNEVALNLAQALEKSPHVERVYYPGLKSHPDHVRASEWFRGFGGMLSLDVRGGMEKTLRFLQALSIPFVAPSLGGVESLVTRPATTSHRSVPPADRIRLGITDSLVRVSVGLEHPEDLVADFLNALEKAQ